MTKHVCMTAHTTENMVQAVIVERSRSSYYFYKFSMNINDLSCSQTKTYPVFSLTMRTALVASPVALFHIYAELPFCKPFRYNAPSS